MRFSDIVTFIIKGSSSGYDEMGNIITTPDVTKEVVCHVNNAVDGQAFSGFSIGFGKIETGGIKIRMRISEFDTAWTQAVYKGNKYSLQSVSLGHQLVTIHGVRVYG